MDFTFLNSIPTHTRIYIHVCVCVGVCLHSLTFSLVFLNRKNIRAIQSHRNSLQFKSVCAFGSVLLVKQVGIKMPLSPGSLRLAPVYRYIRIYRLESINKETFEFVKNFLLLHTLQNFVLTAED